MFLMNYLFDFDRVSGEFSGDRRDDAHPGELYSSKNWLKLAVALAGEPEPFVEGTPFNPEPRDWQDLLDMDSGPLVVPSTPGVGPGPPLIKDESNFGIRIGLDPLSPATPALRAVSPVIELTVCFGRPSAARQRRSSPFHLIAANGAQIVQTTFIHRFVTPAGAGDPTGHDTDGNPTWFWALGLVRHRPGNIRHRAHRYEFAVGIKVTAAGVTHHYSHDPEMDIEM